MDDAARAVDQRVGALLRQLARRLPETVAATSSLHVLHMLLVRLVLFFLPFVQVTVAVWRSAVDALTCPYQLLCSVVLFFFGWPIVMLALWVYVAYHGWRMLCACVEVSLPERRPVPPMYVMVPSPEAEMLAARAAVAPAEPADDGDAPPREEPVLAAAVARQQEHPPAGGSRHEFTDPTDYLPAEYLAEMQFFKRRVPLHR